MTTFITESRILILDFGSQYTQIIARRVREMGVYCEIHPYHYSETDIQIFAPTGIILSGSFGSVLEDVNLRAPQIVFDLGCPVLGICYGMQTMSVQLGGSVRKGKVREFGYAQALLKNKSKLFHGIEDAPGSLDVWMSHGDEVEELPEGFSITASTHNCPIVSMENESRKLYGLQFHPEVSHTKQGRQILERFVLDICRCQPTWTPSHILQDITHNIQNVVETENVILGLSGGVDSSVAAVLLHRAIGKQLTCIFVDTGLLRFNEVKEVQTLFSQHLGIKLITVAAEERFLSALRGVNDPEEKRKIVGQLFVEIFEEEAKKIENVKWLAQGTIYSDVIESAGTATSNGHVIKTHHNVGGLPQKMHLKLLEPLRELFKDEVRKLGLELGLPRELLYRHPFPGPGLCVRILGEVKKEYADKLRLADKILVEELYSHDFYYQTSQAFAVFLPIKSVGVMGDARSYEHVIALRVIETLDFMTAHVARLPLEFLEKVANRIINEVRGISRVVYDISGKPPATIEWE